MTETKDKKKEKQDPLRDRNTAICSAVLAVLFMGLALTQKGGLSNGRVVLELILAAVNIVSTGVYFRRYQKQVG